MARRRTLVKKRRRRTNKRRTMRRRRTINKMRGGTLSDNEKKKIEEIKTTLYRYDYDTNIKTHGSTEGKDAMMQALEKHIKLLNKSPYTVIIPGYYNDVKIFNDGINVNYSAGKDYNFSCTIDDFNSLLLQRTTKVEKYEASQLPYGTAKLFEERI